MLVGGRVRELAKTWAAERYEGRRGKSKKNTEGCREGEREGAK